MSTMKILHVCPYFFPVLGGLEHVVMQLSVEMVARGHQVTVFTSDLSRDGRVGPSREDVRGVLVQRFPAWVRLGAFASLWPGFAPRLRREHFDVVHAHSYRHPHCDLAAVAIAGRNTKLIIDPHWPAYPRSMAGGALDRVYDALLGRRLLRAADLVLCATPLEVPWLRAMGARTIRVVPHGISRDYLGRQDGESVQKRLDSNDFRVLSIGRIDESKGFQFVVQALRKLEGVRYVIAGPRGTFYPQLVKMISSYGLHDRVILLGEIPEEEKREILDACDAFIQPSLFEAYGVSTLEAMARGKPCLASKVGGLPWLVNESGLLFNVGDADEIARCLRVLRDRPELRASLGAAGRTKAARLTWDQVVPEYEQILLELTEQRPSHEEVQPLQGRSVRHSTDEGV